MNIIQKAQALAARLRKAAAAAGEKIHSAAVVAVVRITNALFGDIVLAVGRYHAECFDSDGNLLWSTPCPNTVVTVGKNYLLDNGMAGSAYTAAFYMGLITSTSYSAISASDTMASHAGWLEGGGANAPAYSQTTRPTAAWLAASAGVKSLSSALTFSITSSGTLEGAFLTTVSTKDGTTGTLFSAGLFTGGTQPVTSGNTVNVSYSLTLT